MLMLGVGLGAAIVPLTLTTLSSAPPVQAGIASALVNSCQQLGGSIGLAVLGTVAAGAGTASAGGARAFAVAAGALAVATVLALAIPARRSGGEVAAQGASPVRQAVDP